ncbi:MAG: FAD-dependent monooxygenase [Lachnospiraceae bacterium]|nr:FAD-dependent monooxygenase [Lachnospiraceae bacterium]
MIKIDSIKISAKNKNDIKEYVTSKFCPNNEIKDFIILKKSLDARDKSDIKYVYSAAFSTEEKLEKSLIKKNKNVSFYEPTCYKLPVVKDTNKNMDIVVCGMGPAGLFAALLLTEAGFKVTVIDRGKKVEDRVKDVEKFFNGGMLNVNSNIQFGEGGAGTFSDGKLNTGIKDKEGRKEYVLKQFIEYGANENILYDSKPHIGTDVLRDVVKNIRLDLERKGTKFLFSTEFISFRADNGILKEI